MSVVPYTLLLTAASGIWSYSPERDTLPSSGWNVSYSGNPTWPITNTVDPGEGNLYLRTQLANASIAAEFVGTGLILCVTDNNASFSVRFDGQEPTTEVPNDPQCISQGAAKTISFVNQEFKSHRVELNITNASSAREFQFYGAVIETHIALLSAEDSVYEKVIDDRDPGWDMTRQKSVAWDNNTDTRYYQATASYTCVYGHGPASEAAYTFSNASAVALIGQTDYGTRYYSVILEGDGGTLTTLDSINNSSWHILNTVNFLHSGLDMTKQYTLRYRNWSDSHPHCSRGPDGDCCQVFDSLILIGSRMKSSGISPSTTSIPLNTSIPPGSSSSITSSSSSNTALIAGGVVGGLAGALILVVALFFLWRYRKRSVSSHGQHAPNPLPSGRVGSYTTDMHRPMFQLATALPPPGTQGGFIGSESVSPSDYFATTIPAGTSTISGSTRDPVGADSVTTPWLVDSSGSPVIVGHAEGSTSSQVISSRRSPDNPLKSPPPTRSRKAEEAALNAETSVEMPPPYRG